MAQFRFCRFVAGFTIPPVSLTWLPELVDFCILPTKPGSTPSPAPNAAAPLAKSKRGEGWELVLGWKDLYMLSNSIDCWEKRKISSNGTCMRTCRSFAAWASCKSTHCFPLLRIVAIAIIESTLVPHIICFYSRTYRSAVDRGSPFIYSPLNLRSPRAGEAAKVDVKSSKAPSSGAYIVAEGDIVSFSLSFRNPVSFDVHGK